MAMSSRSRSGFSALVRLIADSPSLAAPTSCAPSALARRSCSRSVASGSSSAMRTLSGLFSDMRLHRHCERYFVPTAGHRSISAACTAAPAGLEPLADIGEAEARAFVGCGGELILTAILQAIADLQHHPVAVEMARFDADEHCLAALRHPVF